MGILWLFVGLHKGGEGKFGYRSSLRMISGVCSIDDYGIEKMKHWKYADFANNLLNSQDQSLKITLFNLLRFSDHHGSALRKR